ncbi:hypothetical protein TH66_09840 [Carbonactinospora thermoautotrophica]|uniref:ABC-2 type transporter n=1 Tax=Carbonactinospora thermoautotrophica TaxID=1469144 RepID=A0A132MNJ5_9ACTN|nr:ABC transporter permease [Carbonactinospora thermoautotrophica]KWW99363.1 ABC-2 type transporter [Carbonactinospora thermoautotrophica]KWX04181.1 hypothetical protein TH66_09840 [Carbonactinospora thermoautotrophica]KWX06901.1 hypothetical protein TR74_20515 [Carbonactinospora thermoautotrophica]
MSTLAPTAPRASALRTCAALILRDLRVIRRDLVTFVVRVVMQPLLFVFVFAYVLPKIGPGGGSFAAGAAPGRPTFSTVLVPGMVASALVFTGLTSVVMQLVMELSWTKEIEDRLLAPVPVWLVGLQKIVSGALQGLIAAALVFPAVLFVHAEGQGPSVEIHNWPLFLLVMVASALLSAALGLLIGCLIEPNKAQAVFTVIMLPATMLGCVYYSWAALEQVRWLQVAVLVNPVVYMSEGLRAVLLGGLALIGWLAVQRFARRVLD